MKRKIYPDYFTDFKSLALQKRSLKSVVIEKKKKKEIV